MAIERETYIQKAYAAVRRMIIDGDLPPGAKVVVRPLAESLGLSPTPIKAALAALERDGFLVAQAHRGYFVPTTGAQDMREIYELREVLEGIAARKIAEREDRAPIVGDLWGWFQKQSARAELEDTAGYSEINVAFHQAIWQAAGNARLAHVAENLQGQLRLATGASSRSPGRMRCAMNEHRAIIEAIEQGDPQAAEAESRAHVRSSAQAYLAAQAVPAGD